MCIIPTKPSSRTIALTGVLLFVGTMVIIGGSGVVAAQSNFSVADRQVAPDGTISPTISGTEGERLTFAGDTDGWTIESSAPSPGLAVLTQVDSLPYTSSDEKWVNLATSEWELTLSPPPDADVGDSYSFDVTEGETDSPVNSDTFTVSIVESTADDGSDDGDNSDNSPTEITAPDTTPNGQTNIVLPADDSVRVSGDVDEWTISSANPGPGLAVFPSVDRLPYTWNTDVDGDTWANLNGGTWEMTLIAPSEPGTYNFTLTEGDPSNPVRTENFSIEVSPTEAPDWVLDSNIVTVSQFEAFDGADGSNPDGELTDSEIREGVSTYVANGDLTDNNENRLGLDDGAVREFIGEYVKNS